MIWAVIASAIDATSVSVINAFFGYFCRNRKFECVYSFGVSGSPEGIKRVVSTPKLVLCMT